MFTGGFFENSIRMWRLVDEKKCGKRKHHRSLFPSCEVYMKSGIVQLSSYKQKSVKCKECIKLCKLLDKVTFLNYILFNINNNNSNNLLCSFAPNSFEVDYHRVSKPLYNITNSLSYFPTISFLVHVFSLPHHSTLISITDSDFSLSLISSTIEVMFPLHSCDGSSYSVLTNSRLLQKFPFVA